MTVGTQEVIDCPICGFINRDLWDVNPTEDTSLRIHCDWCDSPLLITVGPTEGTIEATVCL